MRLSRDWPRLVAALLLLAVFVGLASASRLGSALSGWDLQVTDAFVSWRTSEWTGVFWVFTLLGDDSLVAPLTGALVVLVAARGHRVHAVTVAGGMVLGWVAIHVAKALAGRPRPPEVLALIEQPTSHSMPSGHALIAVVFCGLAAYAAFRWVDARGFAVAKPLVGLLAIVLAAGIGLSRVYLGVHWLSDVIAGWCLGGSVLLLTLHVTQDWRRGGGPAVLRGTRPWVTGWGRWALVAVVLAIIVAAAALTVWAEPLL